MSWSGVETDGASVLRAFFQPVSSLLAEDTVSVSFKGKGHLGELGTFSASIFLRSADKTTEGDRRSFFLFSLFSFVCHPDWEYRGWGR